MALKTQTGQIYLAQPKSSNYATLYEETFSKQGKSVQLFAVVEIAGGKGVLPAAKREKFEGVAKELVTTFKKSFIAAKTIEEETFEKALAAVNKTLTKKADGGKVDWYGKLNSVLAVFYDNVLILSTTGEASVYLFRDGELSQISDEQQQELKPVKIFTTYTAGGLVKNDRVLLAGSQLFDYLSLERISKFLKEDELEYACEDIIENLSENQEVSFSAFVFETGRKQRKTFAASKPALKSPVQMEKIRTKKTLYFLLTLIWTWIKKLFILLGTAALWAVRFFFRKSGGLKLDTLMNRPRKNRKKLIMTAAVVAGAVLLLAIGVSAVRNSMREERAAVENRVAAAERALNEAEAAMIYQDVNRAVRLLLEAQTVVEELGEQIDRTKREELAERIEALKQKTQKQTELQDIRALTQFPNIPTELIRSVNGILGFNRHTGTISFYDFRTGDTRPLLSGQNTGRFLSAGFVGGTHGFVLLTDEGRFVKLDPETDEITDYETESAPLADIGGKKIQALYVFGAGSNARIYALDQTNSQILRMDVNAEGITPSENWIEDGGVSFTEARDLAIDGSIYVLYPDGLEEFFAGRKEGLTLDPLLPELRQAERVYTSAESSRIYISDPENNRILVFDKNGALVNQLLHDRFSEAGDLYADEQNQILYVLSGSDLLHVNLE